MLSKNEYQTLIKEKKKPHNFSHNRNMAETHKVTKRANFILWRGCVAFLHSDFLIFLNLDSRSYEKLLNLFLMINELLSYKREL